MREIKFRCFIKSKNQMLPVISLVNMNDEEGIRVFPDKPIVEWEQINYLTSEGGIELMQFTWLKDKNGKEIYEGDILWYENIFYDASNWDSPIVLCVVEWVNCSWKIWWCELRIYESEEVEVIWNRFENPDLIP